MFKHIFAGLALALSAVASASAAPVLIVQDGKLMGAAKIEINSVLYDVAFADGSFNSLYPTGFSNFAIQGSANFATAAANALGEQVFNAGIYDTNPGLTNGCASNVQECFVYTPLAPSNYPAQIVARSFRNGFGTGDAVFGSWAYAPTDDFTSRGNRTYAIWSVHSASPADVPEPGTALMISLGLAAFGFSRRRRS